MSGSSIADQANPQKYQQNVNEASPHAVPTKGYALSSAVIKSAGLASQVIEQAPGGLTAANPQAALTQAANAAQVAVRGYQAAIAQTAATQQALQNQAMLADLASKEAAIAQKNYGEIENEVVGYQRRAEINTYYAKQYAAQAGVMKLLVWVCIPLLLIAVLKRRNMITANLANVLSGLILVVGLILFIVRVYDLSSRNNMNFDEYTFVTPTDLQDETGGGETVLQYDKRMFLGLDTDDQTGLAWVGATILEAGDRGVDDIDRAADKGFAQLSTAVGGVTGEKKTAKEMKKDIAATKREAAKAAAAAKKQASGDRILPAW